MLSNGTYTLAEFQKNPAVIQQELKVIQGAPIALTVDGKPEYVVYDAKTHMQIMAEMEHARFIAAIKEGIADAEAGRVQSIDEAFADIWAELDKI